jgi:hypothetical protein
MKMIGTHPLPLVRSPGILKRSVWEAGLPPVGRAPSAIAADAETGRYKAKPSRGFRFEDIRQAHRAMESNEAKGKMVVVL